MLCSNEKNTTNKVSQLYNKLDPVAKGYFDIIINEDKSLYKYHKKYVKSETSMKKSALYDVVSELKELNSDLIALDIPTSARYAFLAAASGMSVGVADGPLPIADIIGAFVAIGAIGILAMESNYIIEGKDVENFDRMVKFNKKTLEYLVYEKSSKRIISYFLPKWTAYNNGTISSKKEWIKEALEYALRHISRK